MKLLFIGDIVGRPGRAKVKEILPGLRKDLGIDVVVACSDNLAHGRGATAETIREMMNTGVDFFTGGDHIFHNPEFAGEIEDLPIVRPANFPGEAPGYGYKIFNLGKLGRLLLINLQGKTSFGNLGYQLENPFTVADNILCEFPKEKDFFSLVDFHADATSEKNALAFYLDGRVTAVLGTHTHIPTCDPRILPKGTMFVTDVGMTGNIDSVLGVKTDIIINSFLTALPQKFEWENTGTTAFRSVLLDSASGTIKRLDF